MKIGIIGVGSVGGAIASRIVAEESASELVLFDTDKKRLRSAVLDLDHAAAFGGGVEISTGYPAMKGADMVIISAGANQRIGESRSELVLKNAEVMRDVVPKIMAHADKKKIILIVVSNPLDSIVMTAQKISGLAPGRVIGTGTMLDSARFRAELSRRFKVSPKSVSSYVLGEHGDSAVLNWTSANIGGLPIQGVTAKEKTEIEGRVRGAAMEIIQGRGATWDGIAAATCALVRAIDNDERRILPVSIIEKGVAYSLPRIVGREGVAATLPPVISADEKKALATSIKTIQKTYKAIK